MIPRRAIHRAAQPSPTLDEADRPSGRRVPSGRRALLVVFLLLFASEASAWTVTATVVGKTQTSVSVDHAARSTVTISEAHFNIPFTQPTPPQPTGTPTFTLNGNKVDANQWPGLEPILQNAGARTE